MYDGIDLQRPATGVFLVMGTGWQIPLGGYRRFDLLVVRVFPSERKKVRLESIRANIRKEIHIGGASIYEL